LLPLPQQNEIITAQLYTGEYLDEAENAVRQCIGTWIWSSRDTLGYKVGITANPEHRWSNTSYGYEFEEDEWIFMHVVVQNQAPFIRRLEKRMTVLMTRDRSRCHNRVGGGGGISDHSPGSYYLYVVFCTRW